MRARGRRHGANSDGVRAAMNRVATPPPSRKQRLALSWMIAATVLALTACSGGGPTPSGSSVPAGRPTRPPSAIAYSVCMRAHGVPNYPDPDSKGNLRPAGPQQLGVSTISLPSGRASLPAGPPEWGLVATTDPTVPAGRRLPASLGTATADHRAKVRPVPSLPRNTQLARPHHQPQGWPSCFRSQWCRPQPVFPSIFKGFLAIRCQRSAMPTPCGRHGADLALHMRWWHEAVPHTMSSAPKRPGRGRPGRGRPWP